MSRWDLEDALEVAMVFLVAWNQCQVKYLSAGNIRLLQRTYAVLSQVSDKSRVLMVISKECCKSCELHALLLVFLSRLKNLKSRPNQTKIQYEKHLP